MVWVGCTYPFKVSGGAWSVSNERSVEQHEIHHVNLVASAQLMMIDDDILRQAFLEIQQLVAKKESWEPINQIETSLLGLLI